MSHTDDLRASDASPLMNVPAGRPTPRGRRVLPFTHGVVNLASTSTQDIGTVWTFEDVYQREYPGLVAVATAMTGDRDGAQDLVHDAMVRALTRWDQVSMLDRPGAWCHHVLLNLCRSRLRRRATEWRYFSRLRRSEPTQPGPSEETIAFWSATRSLPDRPRAVVALYFGADMTSVQIAGVLGVPEGTVRTDLAAARRYIVRALGTRGAGDD